MTNLQKSLDDERKNHKAEVEQYQKDIAEALKKTTDEPEKPEKSASSTTTVSSISATDITTISQIVSASQSSLFQSMIDHNKDQYQGIGNTIGPCLMEK